MLERLFPDELPAEPNNFQTTDLDAGGAEVGVAELALDDVERHALAGELDGVRVAQLVRREAAPDTRLGGEPAELDAHVGARPRPPAGRAVDDAEQWPDGSLDACAEPGCQLLPTPGVHADLAPAAALAAAHEQRPRAARRGRAQRARAPPDPQAGAPSTTIRRASRAP